MNWKLLLGRMNGKALAAPGLVVMILALMILPVPSFILDIFFSFNIALSIIVLLTALYTVRPLEFMAFPAVLCFYLLRPLLAREGRPRAIAAFCCGALSVAGAGLLTALSLSLTSEGFVQAARVLFAAHVPVMVAEGIVTALAVSFLARVRPEILNFS